MEMMKTLKKKGHDLGALLVNETNTEAQDFYRKQGFTKGFLFRWMSKEL
jgi:ribosomal protein S18 acetylase RimI-like enzyme